MATQTQMGLFETTEIKSAPTVVPPAVEPEPPEQPQAEVKPRRSKAPVEPPRFTPRSQPDAAPSETTEKPMGERRVNTTRIWGVGPQGAYRRILKIVYYVAAANETATDLPQHALPRRPCSCGRRRFIANVSELHHWRCMRCHPPVNNECIVIYDVAKPEEVVPC